jgi:phenylpropionate dioxygenase-like ring-hydroxylating dioxygenase large terminal subunit
MFVKNLWYVAGWSSDVPAGALLDRWVAGERAVFFRTAEGQVKALENRCLHRAAPLSLGAHEGDGIRCSYHGIKYDGGGVCTEIPGQATIPPRARLRSYPVVERQGWIWFWPGDPGLADEAKIPRPEALGEPGWKIRTGMLPYDAHYELVNDNLLDLSHISYLHRETFGGGDLQWAETVPRVERRENGFHFERWMPNQPVLPTTRSLHAGGARYDQLNIYDFMMPGVLAIDSRFQQAGSGTRERMSNIGYRRTMSWQAITPATERTTHYFFSIGIAESEPDSKMDVLFQGMLKGFEEDRSMIEAQQRVIDEDPAGRGVSSLATAHDAAMLQVRAMTRRMIEGEKLGGSSNAA